MCYMLYFIYNSCKHYIKYSIYTYYNNTHVQYTYCAAMGAKNFGNREREKKPAPVTSRVTG